MIQITPQTRIFVAIQPVDFRLGIDSLSRMVRDQMKKDSFSGSVFVFRNRLRTSIKAMAYDGMGFWLCQKRMSSGKFRFWPSFRGEAGRAVQANELEVLLRGDFGSDLEWRQASATSRSGRSSLDQGSVGSNNASL